MKKVRFTKNYKEYKKNQVIEVTNNIAFGLIDKGIAKEFADYKNKMFKKYKNK